LELDVGFVTGLLAVVDIVVDAVVALVVVVVDFVATSVFLVEEVEFDTTCVFGVVFDVLVVLTSEVVGVSFTSSNLGFLLSGGDKVVVEVVVSVVFVEAVKLFGVEDGSVLIMDGSTTGSVLIIGLIMLALSVICIDDVNGDVGHATVVDLLAIEVSASILKKDLNGVTGVFVIGGVVTGDCFAI
jgi:hypothetical protein